MTFIVRDMLFLLCYCFIFILGLFMMNGRKNSYKRMSWWICSTALLVFAILLGTAALNAVTAWVVIYDPKG